MGMLALRQPQREGLQEIWSERILQILSRWCGRTHIWAESAIAIIDCVLKKPLVPPEPSAALWSGGGVWGERKG